MSTTTEIATLQLSGTKKGKIIISNITEPYGKETSDVVSIGIALNGKDIEWKSHIPYGSLDDVIEVLQKVSQEKKAQNA
ncbi:MULTISPECIES: hypothetical protein [Malaciobacter]|jgi:hypothetical protein|uniref:Uncharacterized protein n=2 Tax=Malaciobacter TaxID=2321114 RepID=A0AB36ZTR2_9BACT|nr:MULTISPECIES: hypothetical protein [Malaciobacter]PHO09732.1 hypothetical protein CPG37_08350 [Malaciobacter canalis]PPK60150.1 hypothetical protein B0F89_1287 [Malaciobacter marinus]QEE34057.1 hypothetical protein ACAN_2623 [Malaciobacter canalis]SKB68861.1 hypothetical protein SAMN06295997_13127 [Malaciobacter marinus]